MNSNHTEAEYLSRLRREVERSIDGYVYEVPDDAIGNRMTDAAISDGLAQLRASLVEPYWTEVEVRDTFEQVKTDSGPQRKCAVIADDGKGMLLMFDPLENSFVLAHWCKTELITIGVRGDAVGCFLSR
jgi:hypothetical protein